MMPIGRWLRAASCAAAMDCWRPMVSGSTMPGNSTVLRTGRMISTSSGRRDGAGDLFSALAIARCLSHSPQVDRNTAVRELLALELVRARREHDLALEPALRYLQAPDGGVAELRGPRPHPGDAKRVGVDLHPHFLGRHTGQRHHEHHAVGGLEEVHRRLPGRTGRGAGALEELPVQAFGRFEQLEGLGPHVTAMLHGGLARGGCGVEAIDAAW